jgi:hypothetical protein
MEHLYRVVLLFLLTPIAADGSAPAEHSPTALHLFYTTGAFGGSTDGWVIAESAPGANLTGMAGEFGAAQCRLERF